jgi:DNA-binding beta-propeller fold protein YncE
MNNTTTLSVERKNLRRPLMVAMGFALVASSLTLNTGSASAADPVIPVYVGDLAGPAVADLTPVDVTTDGTFYYVIDVARYRIVKIRRSTGAIVDSVGGTRSTTEGGIAAARAIAIDSAGNIYVADTPNAWIQKFTNSLTFVDAWGAKGSGAEEFDQVYGVAIGMGRDGGGPLQEILYTVDGDSRLKKWRLDGTFIGDFSPGIILDQPRQVEVHPTTNDVWVVNSREREIVVIDVDGNERVRFGSEGTGNGQFSGDPRGITISADGTRAFVSDDGNHRVQVFDASFGTEGAYIESLGGAPEALDYLVDARGLEATGDGKLIVTDEWDYDLKQFTISESSFDWTFFGAAASLDGVNSPRGLAIDSAGRIYASDWWNQRIDRWDSDGSNPFMWGFRGTKSEDGSVNFAWDVAVQPGTDRVFLANRESHEIEVFESNGGYVTRWGIRGTADGRFEFPQGVAFAPDGTLVVTDSGNGRIQRFSIDAGGDGTFVAAYGTPGSAEGKLNLPAGIDVAADGTIWVADTRNDRIQSYNPATTTWTVHTNATGLSSFRLPWGVTVAPDGAIWVADSGRNRIVKMLPDGTGLFEATGPDMGATDLNSPSAIAFGLDGTVYVSDIWNNRIIHLDPDPTPPTNTVAPAVSGSAQVGGELSVTDGTWTGTDPITYTYQWQRCDGACSNIAGATGSAYTVTALDVGSSLRAVVIGTNVVGSDAETSAKTAVVHWPPIPPGSRFVDDDGNIHEAAIEAIAAVGITLGCNPPTNDRFCPDDPMTRGATAAFLNRALGLDPTGIDYFTDDNTSVFEGDINRLAAAGITKGCNPPANDRYCPDDPVTRGVMAAFLTRALNLGPTGIDYFTDDDTSVFEDDINRLAAAGITLGCNPPANDQYCPNSLVTRAEMATFLTRALDLDTS